MASGLFPSQAQVFAAQQAQQAANPIQTLAGGIFNLGDALGDAGRRGIFGQETRSPAELAAGKVQQIAQRIDFNDRESIMGGINALNDAGFQDQAFQLFNTLPQQQQVKPKLIGRKKVRIEEPGNTGNFAIQEVEVYDDGSYKYVGPTVTEQAAATTSSDPNLVADNYRKSFQANDDIRQLWLTRLSGHERLKTGNNTELENLLDKGMEGRISQYATQLKNEKRMALNREIVAYRKQFKEWPDPLQVDQLALQVGLDDATIAGEAFDLMAKTREFDDYITDNWIPGTEANVTVPYDDSLDSQKNLRQREADAAAVRAAEQEVATSIPPLVLGDPGTGAFRPEDLDLNEAKFLFSNLGGPRNSLSNEELVTELSKFGYNFNKQGMLQYHIGEWNNLRDAPEVVRNYFIHTGQKGNPFNNDPNENTFGAWFAGYLNDKGDNPQATAEAMQAVKYLRQFRRMQKSKPGLDRPQKPLQSSPNRVKLFGGNRGG